jgi:probable rRNA maturation factor
MRYMIQETIIPRKISVSIELELQIATHAKTLPHPAQIREWVSLTLYNRIETGELTIRLVDETESADLNQQYRNKPGPTNVLSFPYDPEPGIASRLLGDIVICAPVVEQEAIDQNKSLLAHWAHMVIHGTLHLLGYTHEFDDDATEMENLETEILLRLNFPPPYGDVIVS